MKNLVPIILLIFLFSIPWVSFSQTVDEIIEKNIEARGGKDKLNAVKTIFMEGSEQSGGHYSIAFKTVIVQDKLFRTDVRADGRRGFVMRKKTEGVSEIESWRFDPMYMRKPEKVNDTTAGGRRSQQAAIDIVGDLFNYNLKGHKAVLVGKDSAKGGECYKIELTLKDGSADAYWINTKSYLVIQKQTIGLIQSNGTYIEVYGPLQFFSNYRPVDGVLFPFSGGQVFTTAKGTSQIDTNYTTIEINKPVDPKLYQPKTNKKL